MISVAEARAIMLAHAAQLATEDIPLTQAFGRTLGAPIVAPRAQPPFTASAMDGYAVRGADTPGVLAVVGEAGAGRALPRPLQAGEAARIFTGAPLPEGADAVVIQENVERSGEQIAAPRVDSGRHVRAVGIDFEVGASLLEAGRVFDGAALALAAAAGRASVRVGRMPRIAILAGGDEIVAPGASPGPSQIFDCVSYGIAGLAAAWGASPATGAPFTDDIAVIASRIDGALGNSDIVVVVGGASVGEHDHARAALTSIGAELLFAQVAVRPGKPTWFARRGQGLILGLPGNPASALVCARLFLRPLLDRMLGRAACWATQSARLRAPLAANGPRETYWRATSTLDESGQFWVERLPNQDSSLVSVFAAANALIVQAPHEPARATAELVPILRL